MATVIKAEQQDPKLLRRLETVSVSDHLGEAQLVLERSREQARQLLRQAQEEAKKLRHEASEKGYEAGFRRGYEAGKKAGYDAAFSAAQTEFEADQTNVVATLRNMLAQYEARKRDLFIAARGDVVRFAARLAEKVTKQVGALHPESAVANLEAALQLVESQTNLQVHISPSDQSTIERFARTLREHVDGAAHLEIIVDETISPGGCRVTTPDAEVDATLETQLAQIVNLMVPGPGGGGDA